MPWLLSSVLHCVMLPRAVSAQQWNLSGVESAKCIRPAVQFLAFLMFMDGINGSDIKILKGIAEHSLITFFLNRLHTSLRCWLFMRIWELKPQQENLREESWWEQWEVARRNEMLRTELFPLRAVISLVQLEAAGIQSVWCDCQLSVRHVL